MMLWEENLSKIPEYDAWMVSLEKDSKFVFDDWQSNTFEEYRDSETGSMSIPVDVLFSSNAFKSYDLRTELQRVRKAQKTQQLQNTGAIGENDNTNAGGQDLMAKMNESHLSNSDNSNDMDEPPFKKQRTK